MIKIAINPVSKPRMTQQDKWKKRCCVVKYWTYKDELKQQVEQNNFELQESFAVQFFVEMPKSWSKKKKVKMLGSPHRQKPDVDNLLKGLMDALLKEDSSVHTVMCSKVWSDRGGVEITNLYDGA